MAAYDLAFSDKSQLATLTVKDDEPGAAVASVEELGIGSLRQAVMVFSVDDFMQWFSPPFPAHIKIDVDGLEGKILDGSHQTLADKRLKSLLIEIDERDLSPLAQIEALLTGAGFQLTMVQRSPLAPNSASRNRIYRRG